LLFNAVFYAVIIVELIVRIAKIIGIIVIYGNLKEFMLDVQKFTK